MNGAQGEQATGDTLVDGIKGRQQAKRTEQTGGAAEVDKQMSNGTMSVKSEHPEDDGTTANGFSDSAEDAVPSAGSAIDTTPDILDFHPGDTLDADTYAVLPNDWPYNVPRGVDHCLVWSKVRSCPPSPSASPGSRMLSILRPDTSRDRSSTPPSRARPRTGRRSKTRGLRDSRGWARRPMIRRWTATVAVAMTGARPAGRVWTGWCAVCGPSRSLSARG